MVTKRIDYLEYEFFTEKDIKKFKENNPKIKFIRNDEKLRWDVLYLD